ncbi:phospholipase D-like domain-containing protein [Tahibacter amnicola]|uniref:Phospholipase D-like domain-containing protein n=1 Tax=Tahibacter amnicola TaxID=2976241 RepID=A0ABY6B9M3_9GAMM|nr:phospholipase D-like domain-containing protein [Tahibacter amnicola]UXI66555.1 phospholipase D-like domain-containing protein [Tahibacter amnicola]
MDGDAETRPPLLQPGSTCWRIETAGLAACLIDAQCCFRAMREALCQARRSVFLLGWDIDSRMTLTPEDSGDGFPQPLGEFFDALAHARPDLNIYLLSWDYAMLFAMEREWLPEYRLNQRTHRRVHFRLDSAHPLGASHHQKVLVIDDALAFVGGLDLTRCRWDTTEHAVHDDRRRDAAGKRYAPFHDVHFLVDGNAACALGELARERWRRCTGETLAQAQPHPVAWPPSVTPDFRDVPVAIARTEPEFPPYPAVNEIQRLLQSAILGARDSVFIENQYFTSKLIGDAIATRLQESNGPEIVVIAAREQCGWLEQNTMGVLRSRLDLRLRAADSGGRYRTYCPQLCEESSVCLNVHSKVLIVDDTFLTIGSANLSNRSLFLDTECNVAIVADGDRAIQEGIRAIRDRLLAEHLDTPLLLSGSTCREAGA